MWRQWRRGSHKASGVFISLVATSSQLSLDHLTTTNRDRTMSASKSSNEHNSDSDEYTIPLQDQRVFGAGLKRKRIHFVPSSASNSSISSAQPAAGPSVAQRYLSLVLPETEDFGRKDEEQNAVETQENDPEICDICNLPLKANQEEDRTHTEENGRETHIQKHTHIHEATLPHQLSLPHSHPPSSLSRSRLGLKILSAQGWDPDSRVGLGRDGEGVRFPVKVKEKDDKLGVGVVVPKEIRNVVAAGVKGRVLGGREKGIKKLDAKEVRRKAEKDKKDGEKLREMFYGREDVERYLRG